MNIKDAKTEIIHSFRAYHRKDKNGNYLYPRIRQRPLLLIGPPGIGKTAIMEQAAEECRAGLVAYTITHHTRQSAIGLPRIETKNYAGCELTVTEYTMSEIVASVYECMERTGKKEGILFIDEINCVSETLAPTMLEFLQNKTFGSHKIPEGWMIVAAGNPPEYNKSVREFDIATLDRVRCIQIDADAEVWQEYAREHQIHSAVCSYLTIHEECFYLAESSADALHFVTARGWEDLSEILKNYEELEIPVTRDLIFEFIQKEETAQSFYAHYQLYQKYGTDYCTEKILEGTVSRDEYHRCLDMAAKAESDERVTVTEWFLDGLLQSIRNWEEHKRVLDHLYETLKYLKKYLETKSTKAEIQEAMDSFIRNREESFSVKKQAELLSESEEMLERCILAELKGYLTEIRKQHLHESCDGFAVVESAFRERVASHREESRSVIQQTERAFAFVREGFGEGQEVVLMVSVLSRNRISRAFFSTEECESFLKYSEKLLYREREKELQKACLELL